MTPADDEMRQVLQRAADVDTLFHAADQVGIPRTAIERAHITPENGLAMLHRTSSSSDNVRTPRPADPVTGRLLEERRVAAWIGKSILLKGDLTSSEDLTIAGQVEGDISVPEHSLIITPQAKVRGNIVARFVVVHGSVTGTITAAEKVDVGATGCVDGDIVAVRMAIAEGATLRGQIGVDGLAPRT